MKEKLKQEFVERMEKLLGKSELKKYLESLKTMPKNSVRVNTLKISPNKLKQRLEKKGWKIKQPFKKYPEIIIIESALEPGELGRSLEHMLGYYYVQELSSMLPPIVLNPKPREAVLDLAAAPGSKTTQIAAMMNNAGLLIANEISLGRLRILSSNAERCGVTNTIITRKEGTALCKRFKKNGFAFDKILLDAPCSGEGTLRTKPEKTARMWSVNSVKRLSKIQKNLIKNAFGILKSQGILVYSTCTHSPEENEEVVNFLKDKFPTQVSIEKVSLPTEVRCNPGVSGWQDKKYVKHMERACRIYPHEFNSEGFFIAKFKKLK